MKRGLSLILMALVLASGAVASPAAEVTLLVQPYYDRAIKFHHIRFSGSIPNNAANEYVAVLAKVCGENYETNAAGASTLAGGTWQAHAANMRFNGLLPATYRARWEEKYSEPITIRPRLPIKVKRQRGGHVRVTVEADTHGPKLKGRVVQLQRLRAGRWATVRRARLGTGVSGYNTYVYSATLTYRASKATLRVVVPAKTAAPCYVGNTTKPWTRRS